MKIIRQAGSPVILLLPTHHAKELLKRLWQCEALSSSLSGPSCCHVSYIFGAGLALFLYPTVALVFQNTKAMISKVKYPHKNPSIHSQEKQSLLPKCCSVCHITARNPVPDVLSSLFDHQIK